MKIFSFIKWLLNFNKWESYSKRYLIYIIIGGIGMYYLPIVYLGIVFAGILLFMWLDLGFGLLPQEKNNKKININPERSIINKSNA